MHSLHQTTTMRALRQTLKMVKGPADLPVSAQDVKADLGIGADETIHDRKIETLIQAATAFVSGPDGVLGKALINQTWKLSVIDHDRYGHVYLPLTPVVSVTGISVYNSTETLQVLDVATFDLFGDEDRAYIRPKAGVSWPGLYDRPDAIMVTYVAGFGASPESIPENIKQAIRLLCCHWFENREASVPGAINVLPMGVDALLGISRTGWVG